MVGTSHHVVVVWALTFHLSLVLPGSLRGSFCLSNWSAFKGLESLEVQCVSVLPVGLPLLTFNFCCASMVVHY